eukprot:1908679-Pyramimonas_sp.AAC.1
MVQQFGRIAAVAPHLDDFVAFNVVVRLLQGPRGASGPSTIDSEPKASPWDRGLDSVGSR